MTDGTLEVVKDKQSPLQALTSTMLIHTRNARAYFIAILMSIAVGGRSFGRVTAAGITFARDAVMNLIRGIGYGCAATFRATMNLMVRIRDVAYGVSANAVTKCRAASRRVRERAVSTCQVLVGAYPVPRKDLTHALTCLCQFETQALSLIKNIESREKRVRAFLELARTAHRVGRCTEAALTEAVAELGEEHLKYWTRRQERIVLAVQLGSAVAHLAAISGHESLGGLAYCTAQTYNESVKDVNQRISLAVLLSDVASYVAMFDQSSWLMNALRMSSGIEDSQLRLGAVCYVTRKMVQVSIPPGIEVPEEQEFTGRRGPATGVMDKDAHQFSVLAVAHSDEESEGDFAIFDE